MAERRDKPDRWTSPGEADSWQEREHDAVFRTLDEALTSVKFPASKSRLAEEAGHANVAEDAALPLVKYLQALPEKRYASPDEVKSELDARWQDIRGLRDVGYERMGEPGGG